MICTDYRQRISALADAELDGSKANEVVEHLDHCRECREFYHAIRRLDGQLKLAGTAAVPADLAIRVQARLKGPGPGSGRGAILPSLVRGAVFTLIVLIASGLGTAAGNIMGSMLERSQEPEAIEALMPDTDSSFVDVLIEMQSSETL
jgi:anti-sigma factor RsiW